jgi:hypothetical protein
MRKKGPSIVVCTVHVARARWYMYAYIDAEHGACSRLTKSFAAARWAVVPRGYAGEQRSAVREQGVGGGPRVGYGAHGKAEVRAGCIGADVIVKQTT